MQTIGFLRQTAIQQQLQQAEDTKKTPEQIRDDLAAQFEKDFNERFAAMEQIYRQKNVRGFDDVYLDTNDGKYKAALAAVEVPKENKEIFAENAYKQTRKEYSKSNDNGKADLGKYLAGKKDIKIQYSKAGDPQIKSTITSLSDWSAQTFREGERVEQKSLDKKVESVQEKATETVDKAADKATGFLNKAGDFVGKYSKGVTIEATGKPNITGLATAGQGGPGNFIKDPGDLELRINKDITPGFTTTMLVDLDKDGSSIGAQAGWKNKEGDFKITGGPNYSLSKNDEGKRPIGFGLTMDTPRVPDIVGKMDLPPVRANIDHLGGKTSIQAQFFTKDPLPNDKGIKTQPFVGGGVNIEDGNVTPSFNAGVRVTIDPNKSAEHLIEVNNARIKKAQEDFNKAQEKLNKEKEGLEKLQKPAEKGDGKTSAVDDIKLPGVTGGQSVPVEKSAQLAVNSGKGAELSTQKALENASPDKSGEGIT